METGRCVHRRLIYKEHTSTHAEGADPRRCELARTGLRVAWSPAISRIRDHGRPHPVLALDSHGKSIVLEYNAYSMRCAPTISSTNRILSEIEYAFEPVVL